MASIMLISFFSRLSFPLLYMYFFMVVFRQLYSSSVINPKGGNLSIRLPPFQPFRNRGKEL